MATTAPLGADQLLETLRGTILGLVKGEERDLTARQLAAFLVCYHESEPQTVRGLAEKLNLHKAAVTRAFDRLEEARLLRRKVDPYDRRSVLAVRTAAGQAFFRALKQTVADAAQVAGQIPAPIKQPD